MHITAFVSIYKPYKFLHNELVRGGPREALSDGGHNREEIGWIAIGS